MYNVYWKSIKLKNIQKPLEICNQGASKEKKIGTKNFRSVDYFLWNKVIPKLTVI